MAYDDRQNYLLDADLGVSDPPHHVETAVLLPHPDPRLPVGRAADRGHRAATPSASSSTAARPGPDRARRGRRRASRPRWGAALRRRGRGREPARTSPRTCRAPPGALRWSRWCASAARRGARPTCRRRRGRWPGHLFRATGRRLRGDVAPAQAVPAGGRRPRGRVPGRRPGAAPGPRGPRGLTSRRAGPATQRHRTRGRGSRPGRGRPMGPGSARPSADPARDP